MQQLSDDDFEYIGWRFLGITAEQCSIKIKKMSDSERSVVKELYIGQNPLGSVPKNLCLFPHVLDLDLGSCSLREVPSSLSEMVTLKRIFLEKNSLVSLPKEFGNLPLLEELFCDENWFQEMPNCVFNLLKLTKLYFRNNRIQTIPKSIGRLESLNSIGLSGNERLLKCFHMDIVDNKEKCQFFLKSTLM